MPHRMLRAVSIVLTSAAVVVAFGFVLMYLGGYSGTLQRERVMLIPLIAGLGAGVLRGRERNAISTRATQISILLLAAWAGWVIFRP